MSQNTLDILATEANATPTAARRVVRFGLASVLVLHAAIGERILQLSRGQDATLDVVAGYGDAVEETAQSLRLTGQDCILVAVESDIAGVIGSVTETPSGSGPLITVTGTPTMAFPELFVKVTKAGPAGTAQVRVALDGGTYGPTYDVPAETGAAIVGTVDLTGAGVVAAIGTKTLIFNPGGGDQTVNFATPTTPQEVVDQINTGSTLCTASLVGGRYLRIVTDAVGALETIQVNATSTAEEILGLDTTLHSGAASTHTLVGTGLVLTFPATSDYVLDTIYSCAVTAPRFSNTALGAAMDAFKAAGIKAGVARVCQVPLDATEARQLSDYLKAKLAAWEADAIPIYAHGIVDMPLGTAGSFSTNDNAVKAAFNGESNRNLTCAHGDGYTTGTFVLGTFRRCCGTVLAHRMAAESLSEDPGNGEFKNLSELEWSLTHPNGTTKARDEATATVKMRDARFTVVETRNQFPYFARGVTRAVAGSKFEDVGVLRMGLYGADLMWSAMLAKKNITRDLAASGKLRAADRLTLVGYYRKILEDALMKGADKHASGVLVEIADTDISTTKNPIATWKAQHRAQITHWSGTLEIVGRLPTSGTEAQVIS